MSTHVPPQTHDILVGPENPTDHADFPYTNTLIGRYTNRLPVGEHTLKHASTGTSNQFTVKPNPISGSPRVQLHGGVEGFDKRVFAQLPLASATLFSGKEKAALAKLPAAELWTYTSPAGEEDYPGALRLEVLTALLAADGAGAVPTTSPEEAYPLGSVLLVYRAALEQGAQGPTPINLTQHWGFNLDASLGARRARSGGAPAYGAPADLVREHTLHMAADGVLALDADNNSAGRLDAVAGTGHDFTTPKTIEKGIPARGYDDFYAFKKELVGQKHTLSRGSLEELDEVSPLVGAPGLLGAPLVTLAGATSGLTTQFWSNRTPPPLRLRRIHSRPAQRAACSSTRRTSTTARTRARRSTAAPARRARATATARTRARSSSSTSRSRRSSSRTRTQSAAGTTRSSRRARCTTTGCASTSCARACPRTRREKQT
jgi:aldose 1-epimerase